MPSWWNVEVPGSWEGFRFIGKLRSLRKSLKVWNISVFEDNRVWKLEILERLQVLDRLETEAGLSEVLREERLSLRGTLEELIHKEDVSWRHKAKVSWAKDGDGNSKLFHLVANRRQNKNAITQLTNENGKVLKEKHEVVLEVVSFFSKLYAPMVSPRPVLEGLDWNAISRSEREGLEAPFTLKEVKKMVFGFDRNKSPRPNDFSLAFYQDNWEQVKEDLMKVFRVIYEMGIIDSSMNETYICLIPKKENTTRVQDYSPISLVTSLYKNIAKTLADRLGKVLSSTILDVQGAFVSRRHIRCSLLMRQLKTIGKGNMRVSFSS